jgi:hypothetical protein
MPTETDLIGAKGGIHLPSGTSPEDSMRRTVTRASTAARC